MMQEFIQALRKGEAYQWICDHGHELSKSELCNVIKEYVYSACNSFTDKEIAEINEEIADSLEEQYPE